MESKSNQDLINFLNLTEKETISDLIQLMDIFFSFDMRKFKNSYHDIEEIPCRRTLLRNKLAQELVDQLRYFGTHGVIWTVKRLFKKDPYNNYSKIVYEVAKCLNKSLAKEFRIQIPRVASVEDYETIICEILLKIQFAKKNKDQIREMLKEAGLEEEGIIDSAWDFIKKGGSGGLVISLVKILGKKVVKQLMEQTVLLFVAKIFGKESAEKLIIALFKKISQKALAQIISGLGVAMIAWDIIDLSGPAKRITIPCVSYLSAVRLTENIN